MLLYIRHDQLVSLTYHDDVCLCSYVYMRHEQVLSSSNGGCLYALIHEI